MSKLNVNREVQDPFYRYKMPAIIAKVEGKGNGVKTVIVNMDDIGKAIGRPATYPCKFFGCELGAQTQMDVSKERYVVNGSHEGSRLQDMLDIFIKKFVLCHKCDNPETTMSVGRDKITLLCKACGNKSKVDLRHKLCTYISKNPPPTTKKATVGQAEKSKQDEQVEIKPHQTISSNGGFAEDDWLDDTSAAAVEARMKEISACAASMTMNDDLEKPEKERVNMLYEFVKNIVKSNNVKQQAKAIVNEVNRLEVNNKAPLVLIELLCDVNILNQLETYANIFQKVCEDNAKSQRAMIGGCEIMVEQNYAELFKFFPHILKKLYDLDIAEEDVILTWGKKPSKRYVAKKLSADLIKNSEKVLEWLREAETESEEESEEEDDVVEYAEETKKEASRIEEGSGDAEGEKSSIVTNGNHQQDDDEDDEDFDIDDI